MVRVESERGCEPEQRDENGRGSIESWKRMQLGSEKIVGSRNEGLEPGIQRRERQPLSPGCERGVVERKDGVWRRRRDGGFSLRQNKHSKRRHQGRNLSLEHSSMNHGLRYVGAKGTVHSSMLYILDSWKLFLFEPINRIAWLNPDYADSLM